MSMNVFEQIQGTKPLLTRKLMENMDLSNLLMAWLGRLILMCQSVGCPIEGVQIGELQVMGGEFKARISFNQLALVRAPESMYRDDFFEFAQAKSAAMARAMTKNPDLMKFFQKLVEAIDKHCTYKGWDFKTVRIVYSYITPDNMLVMRVRRQYVES